MVLVSVFDELAGRVVPRGDLVDVEIEGQDRAGDRHKVERRHAGFLAGFAEGNFFDLRLAVGVAAELQPTVELAMMRQQAAAVVSGNNPGRPGDVPRPTGPLETIGVGLDQRDDPIDDVRLGRKRVPVAVEHVEQGAAVHEKEGTGDGDGGQGPQRALLGRCDASDNGLPGALRFTA